MVRSSQDNHGDTQGFGLEFAHQPTVGSKRKKQAVAVAIVYDGRDVRRKYQLPLASSLSVGTRVVRLGLFCLFFRPSFYFVCLRLWIWRVLLLDT